MFRKFLFFCSATLLLMSFTGGAMSEEPDQNNATAADAVTLLKQGQNTGELPAGFVIRLEAHFSHRVPADRSVREQFEAKGVDLSRRRDEVWEFSDGRVHKVTMKMDETGPKRLYERVESTSCKTQKVCGMLLAAEILPLADRQGLGSHRFAGTGYDQGERTIEFLRDGKLILSVGENCTDAGFSEKDAQSFSRLYESLAAEARRAFSKTNRK
jgi:hypothetical protein